MKTRAVTTQTKPARPCVRQRKEGKINDVNAMCLVNLKKIGRLNMRHSVLKPHTCTVSHISGRGLHRM